MIAGAALLVLLGLGLFVAGILTGVTVLYWACVGACVVAAVLLIVVRPAGGRHTRGKDCGQGHRIGDGQRRDRHRREAGRRSAG